MKKLKLKLLTERNSLYSLSSKAATFKASSWANVRVETSDIEDHEDYPGIVSNPKLTIDQKIAQIKQVAIFVCYTKLQDLNNKLYDAGITDIRITPSVPDLKDLVVSNIDWERLATGE